MIKKEYITPEIEEIDLELIETLLDGSTSQDKGSGEIGNDDDIGAKAWGGSLFNDDDIE